MWTCLHDRIAHRELLRTVLHLSLRHSSDDHTIYFSSFSANDFCVLLSSFVSMVAEYTRLFFSVSRRNLKREIDGHCSREKIVGTTVLLSVSFSVPVAIINLQK